VESFGLKLEALPLPLSSAYIVIRYFGSRGRIFNVRFRNLKGGFLSFQETSPDNGDVDFIRAIRTYKEVGYDGLLMPDHVPQIAGDAGGRQAFAYCFGYIQAVRPIPRGPSYRDEFFADKMQADDLGTGLLFKVTHHGVPHHFVEFFQRLGNGENRLTKGFRNIAPLGRLVHDEYDLVRTRPRESMPAHTRRAGN
jgi:hypothetical protein